MEVEEMEINICIYIGRKEKEGFIQNFALACRVK